VAVGVGSLVAARGVEVTREPVCDVGVGVELGEGEGDGVSPPLGVDVALTVSVGAAVG
jgi:hypothetical protein